MLFDERKTAQMAVYFLRKKDGGMSRLKLMKLLYLAERESLARYGVPMTGDHVVSMDHGMVLSQTLELAKGTAIDAHRDGWHAMIACKNQYDHELVRDFRLQDLDELSPADIKILEDIWGEFGTMDRWQIRDYTHTLPEWENPHGTSVPVQFKELLKHIGYSESDAEELSRQREEERLIDKKFQSL